MTQRADIDSCQENRQHTIERRSQTRSQQWKSEEEVRRRTSELSGCRSSQQRGKATAEVSKHERKVVIKGGKKKLGREKIRQLSLVKPRKNRGTADVSKCRRNNVSMCRTDRKCTHGDAPEKQGRRACDAARRKRADGGVVPSVRMGPCSSVRMDPHSSSE